MAVVESSEVVASRRFLLHCFNGSSVGGSRVGRFSEEMFHCIIALAIKDRKFPCLKMYF